MSARIVVVHDDAGFVEETVGALEVAGWDAIGFVDPMTALAELEAAKHVDVLVTGMQFGPGKPHGVSLAMMTRNKRPNLKVLFVIPPQFAENAKGVGEFVVFPVDAATLISAAERLLRPPG